jgi:hypothetical protein
VIGVRFDGIELEDHTESSVRIVTSSGSATVAISRHFDDAFLENVVVTVEPLAGAPGVVLVRVVQTRTDSYPVREEVLVLARVGRRPRIVWSGRGSIEQHWGTCTESRVVSIRAHGDVLRIRSTVSTAAVPAGDPSWWESSHVCRSPRRVHADVPL